MKKRGFNIGIVFLLALLCVTCTKEKEPELLFGESGTFIDSRDVHEYEWIEIGEQVWMRENLNYYTDSGSWVYDNNPINASIYGRLYNWDMACSSCPDGWHLPSDAEWTILSDYLEGTSEYQVAVAGILREEGHKHWLPGWWTGTNESGFTALPGGFYTLTPEGNLFLSIGSEAFFWSSTENSVSSAWDRHFNKDLTVIFSFDRSKEEGLSVRCVKDQ